MELILMFNKLLLTDCLEAEPVKNPQIFAALIAAAVLFVTNIITQIMTLIQYRALKRHNENTLQEKKIEEQRKEIYKKLNDFYGPFQQYLKKSDELYKLFRKDKPKNFRVLTYFLNKEQEYEGFGKVILNENDKILLREIFKIGKRLEDLIVSKAGLVDDPVLRTSYLPNPKNTDVQIKDSGLLAVLSTHLLIIRLAYTNKISGNLESYKDYVFPRELPNRIEENINRLIGQLKDLNSIKK